MPDDPTLQLCAYCAHPFAPTRKWAIFCSTPCQKGFNQRSAARGGPLAPLVLAWIATRHAEPGTEEAEVCRYARREITSMASGFLREDRKAGRAGAVEYVKTLMASGTLYVDRKRS